MTSSTIQWPGNSKFQSSDDKTGISIAWQKWLQNPQFVSINLGNAIGIASGGTGLTTFPNNGQLLIGSAGVYSLNTLTPGTGVGITNGAGSITIANSGVTSLTGTVNQVNVSATTGAVGLSLPQNIDATSNPIFNNLKLTSLNFGGSSLSTYTAGGGWTPADNSGATLVFTGISASYTRIGNMIFAYATFTYPSTVDATAASISGLPVALPNINYAQVPALVECSASIAGLSIVPTKNTANATFQIAAPSGSVTNAQLSGATVSFALTYPAT